MKTLLLRLSVLLVIDFLVVGCSESPGQELRVCKMALQSAQTAGVRFFADAAFQEASDSIIAAEAEIEQQKTKFVLFRDFDRAKQLISLAQKSWLG